MIDLSKCKYELFFTMFPVSTKQQYTLMFHNFMNPEERKNHENKVWYYIFDVTPLQSYATPFMIKGRPFLLHLPKKSFDIALQKELYIFYEDLKDSTKVLDIEICFRRTSKKAIVIDEFKIEGNHSLEDLRG